MRTGVNEVGAVHRGSGIRHDGRQHSRIGGIGFLSSVQRSTAKFAHRELHAQQLRRERSDCRLLVLQIFGTGLEVVARSPRDLDKLVNDIGDV